MLPMAGDLPFFLYILTLSGVLGAVMGSFANCVAWRLARGENPWTGRSRCAACGHLLGVPDLVPVVSYLVLRGRCRHCGARVCARYLAVEVFTGLLYAAMAVRWGLSVQTVQYWLLATALIVAALVDLERFEIPDGCLILGLLVWLGGLPFGPDALDKLLLGLGTAAVMGAAVLLLALGMDRRLGEESLGGGDIKLLALLACWFGPALGLFHLILSCLVGLVFALALGKQRIPFGPAIALAAFATMLVGPQVVNWYLGLFV